MARVAIRTCPDCRNPSDLDRGNLCKACKNARRRNRYAKDAKHKSTRLSQKAKDTTKYYRENKDRIRATAREVDLLRKYGITLAQYDAMLLEQGGVCKTCGGVNATKPLFVDHCHTTGKVRGLLCQNCNWALGCVQDNPEILTALIQYLKEQG
jgi:Zn-finger nucleic acid-binding protein